MFNIFFTFTEHFFFSSTLKVVSLLLLSIRYMLKDKKSSKLSVLKLKETWSYFLSFSSSKFAFTQIDFPFILSQLFILLILIIPKMFKILPLIKGIYALFSSRHVTNI